MLAACTSGTNPIIRKSFSPIRQEGTPIVECRTLRSVSERDTLAKRRSSGELSTRCSLTRKLVIFIVHRYQLDADEVGPRVVPASMIIFPSRWPMDTSREYAPNWQVQKKFLSSRIRCIHPIREDDFLLSLSKHFHLSIAREQMSKSLPEDILWEDPMYSRKERERESKWSLPSISSNTK